MLIDFTVQNYRSIKEPVTLSAVASTRRPRVRKSERTLPSDNEIAEPFEIPGRDIYLLPAIGIFGPNASGKTNVVRALEDLLFFMAFGADAPGSLDNFKPFMFDSKSHKSPTRMHLRVAKAGVIFEYSLVLGRSGIEHERLTCIPAYPKRFIAQLLFERQRNSRTKKHGWKNGKLIGTGYKKIQSSLSEKESFVYFLIRRFNIEALKGFTEWVWMKWPDELRVYPHEHPLVPYILHGKPRIKRRVRDLIRSFDTGISDIELERIEESEEPLKPMKIWATHKTQAGAFRLPFSEESTGTQRLCDLSSKMLLAFDNGTLMIGDELSSSIHPSITRRLIELFQSKESNPKRAQLIFTSHDNTLQKPGLLRRDQIWFTEKKSDGSTDLYPLTDFGPRNDLAVDRAYLDGRFGAIPIIPQDLSPFVKHKK